MKILFASLGAYGHLYPMMPLATACADAGHEVVIATGEPFLDRLPLRTVQGYPASLNLAWALGETRRRHPDLHGEEFTTAMFAEVTPEVTLPATIEQCRRMRPDLVIFEAMHTGAGAAAGVLGIPAAAFAIALATQLYGRLHASTRDHHRDAWVSRRRAMPATDLLAEVLITPVPPSLRPHDPSAGMQIPIRTVPYNEPGAGVPAWLAARGDVPRIYLTLGTVSSVAVDVLARAAEELARLDAEVLVAMGPEGDAAALGVVPGNVHVERFVAQSAVLPLVDLIVHHGGTGTVLGALTGALPQVLLPQHADQFLNADVLARAGAARAILDVPGHPGAIETAARELLGGSAERSVASALRNEIATMPSPREVVSALERVAAGQP